MRRVDSCPACGSGRSRTVVRADRDQRERFLEYSRLKYSGVMDTWLDELQLEVVACLDCGHHWYREQPDEVQLIAMYDASRSFFMDTPVERVPGRRIVQDVRRLRRLVPRGTNPGFLDFGSGYGRWARAAVDAGFDVVAYEPSISRGADEAAPFKVVHDLHALESLRFPVVNLEQVLEHVSDPLSVLQSVKELCAPGAMIRISVPNIHRSHEGDTLWADWPYSGWCVHSMAPFEHLHGFTPRSLRMLLKRAGYRPLRTFRVLFSHPDRLARGIAGYLVPRVANTSVLMTVAP